MSGSNLPHSQAACQAPTLTLVVMPRLSHTQRERERDTYSLSLFLWAPAGLKHELLSPLSPQRPGLA